MCIKNYNIDEKKRLKKLGIKLFIKSGFFYYSANLKERQHYISPLTFDLLTGKLLID